MKFRPFCQQCSKREFLSKFKDLISFVFERLLITRNFCQGKNSATKIRLNQPTLFSYPEPFLRSVSDDWLCKNVSCNSLTNIWATLHLLHKITSTKLWGFFASPRVTSHVECGQGSGGTHQPTLLSVMN